MTRITTGNHEADETIGSAGRQHRIAVKGSENVTHASKGSNRGNTHKSNKKPAKATQKPHKQHRKPRRAVVVAVIAIAAVAACGGGIWYATHSGDGTNTVGVGTTVVNADSTNLQSKDIGSLHDFATEKEYTDHIGGGTVANALAVGNDDGTAVTVDTKMDNIDDGWCGTIVLFDKDGKELGRGDVSMPSDMGGSSETMQYIEVDASQVAYWKLYATDAVDASADFSGIDVVGNENAGDASSDDTDAENANDSDESDGGNAENTDSSANNNASE